MNSSAQLAVPFYPAKAELRGEIPANRQPKWLSDAVAVSLHRERGLVQRVALALGVGAHAVYEAADINNPKPLKAWWIPAICRETNSFAILDMIEGQLGRCAFPLPPVNPHVEEMNRELARSLRLFGEFLETNGDVLADGKIEKHEIGPMLRSLDDMIASLSEYRATVIEKFQADAA